MILYFVYLLIPGTTRCNLEQCILNRYYIKYKTDQLGLFVYRPKDIRISTYILFRWICNIQYIST